MSDLTDYTQRRARRDPEFTEGFETGYRAFKIGALLRKARERSGLTQEAVAERLRTKKSAISRIECHAGDIRVSTLERYAEAIGWDLSLELRPAAGARRTGSRGRVRTAKDG
jgi:transcriptional regulator with XRE-family HTH domain